MNKGQRSLDTVGPPDDITNMCGSAQDSNTIYPSQGCPYSSPREAMTQSVLSSRPYPPLITNPPSSERGAGLKR
uniref:Uncharacterized protein n=1 Tax=Knipowitschia caucasica TaxID=637954 RepID=A0AAV2J4U3_KNICA